MNYCMGDFGASTELVEINKSFFEKHKPMSGYIDSAKEFIVNNHIPLIMIAFLALGIYSMGDGSVKTKSNPEDAEGDEVDEDAGKKSRKKKPKHYTFRGSSGKLKKTSKSKKARKKKGRKSGGMSAELREARQEERDFIRAANKEVIESRKSKRN